MSTHLRLLIAPLALALLMCDAGPEAASDTAGDAAGDAASDTASDLDAADAQPLTGTVHYTLDWDLDRIEPQPGGGWAVTTVGGVRVHVQRGWLVSDAVQLVPCPTTARARPPGPLRMLTLLGPRPARAGHGTLPVEPSMRTLRQVEDLATPAPFDAGTLDVPHERYCSAHYLLGQVSAAPAGAPDDVDISGLTLHLEGTWTPPEGGSPVAFVLQSPWANGAVVALPDPGLDTDGTHSCVTFRRPLAALIDAIDFDSPDVATQQWNAVAAIAAGTAVEVSAEAR